MLSSHSCAGKQQLHVLQTVTSPPPVTQQLPSLQASCSGWLQRSAAQQVPAAACSPTWAHVWFPSRRRQVGVLLLC